MDATSHLGSGIERPVRWSLRLFGGFELAVLATGENLTVPGKRERVLLATLALSPKGGQPRRKLATLLWGDGDDETALDNLRTTIWRLRKVLGDTEHRVIASNGEDIALNSSAFEIDALAFRHLATQSGADALEAAANLYVGELLYGLDIENDEFESWRRSEAGRYREQAVEVLTRLMEHFAESGARERAIDTGIGILRLEPLNEAAVRRLMRFYAGSGRRGAAIELYRTLADALRSELDAEPEAETRSVLAEIARGGEERRAAPSGGVEPASRPVSSIAASSAVSRTGPRTRGWMAVGGLAAALVAVFLLYQFVPWRSRAPDTPGTGTVSIVVLPFVNLSGDVAQDFLSDGMTEEITAALAKVPDLHVVARTSAYQFKAQTRDVQTIGQQLHASHVIEGSVRRAGDRLRITVQLIEAKGGTHLWTDTYDRQLTDIFAVQEDIARAIVTSLRVPLGLNPGENLVAGRGLDPESYQHYLRAKQLVRARTAGAAEAIEALESLIARYPDFAPAWVQLTQAYGARLVASSYAGGDELRRVAEEYRNKRIAAAKRAVELDPNAVEGYWALSRVQTGPKRVLLTEELLLKALALDPNNTDVLNAYSQLLLRTGRLKEALSSFQRVRDLEPFVPVYTGNLGEALWLNGQNDAALAVLISGPRGNARAEQVARVYASMGRFQDAADSVQQLPTRTFPPEVVADASRLLRTAPAHDAAPESLPRLGSLGWVYLYVGAPLRALESHENSADTGGGGDVALLWHPSYAPLRKTERFKELLRMAGMVEYWRVKGWPKFCRPTTGDDFTCE